MASGTRGAIKRRAKNFKTWFKQAVKNKNIPKNAQKANYINKYCMQYIKQLSNIKVSKNKIRAKKKKLKRQKKKKGVKKLHIQGKSIPVINGKNQKILRSWLKQINLAVKLKLAKSKNLILFVLSKTQKSLKKILVKKF